VTEHFRELIAAFPDLQVTIEEPGLVAEGDLVAMRLTVSGTHAGAPLPERTPAGST
jgi:predicted ester cyclase